MDQDFKNEYDRLQEACELQEQIESQRAIAASLDLDLGVGGLGISQYDLSMEDFGCLTGILQEGSVMLTPDSPDGEAASPKPTTPEGGDPTAGQNGNGQLVTPAPMLGFEVLTEDEPIPGVDGLLEAIGELEFTHLNIVENKASAVLPAEPAVDSPQSPPQAESSPVRENETAVPSNEPMIIEWRVIIPPEAMPSLAQQHAASVQPVQSAQTPQPIAEPEVVTPTGPSYPAFQPQIMEGMQVDPYDLIAFPADMVNRMPSPVPNDLSLENMMRAAARRQQTRMASEATQQPPVSASVTVPSQNVIPVVTYSRDQLTVIPSNDQFQTPTPSNEPETQPQSGMSCAQFLSTFDVDSDDDDYDDEEPSVQTPVETEDNSAAQYVQINNGYVLPTNGQHRVFPVQEMYIVTNPSSPSTSPSSSPQSSSGENSPGWEDPQEGTSSGPTRKRQRRSGVDYNTNYICEPCCKTFGKKGSLEQHKRQHHSGPRPWICQACGKAFDTQAKLKNHAANHNPENKRFKCQDCERRYVHRKDRDRHFLTHHGNPTWPCEECPKTFVRRDHLLAHIVAHRRRERRIQAKLAKLAREQQRKSGGNPPPPEGPAEQVSLDSSTSLDHSSSNMQ